MEDGRPARLIPEREKSKFYSEVYLGLVRGLKSEV